MRVQLLIYLPITFINVVVNTANCLGHKCLAAIFWSGLTASDSGQCPYELNITTLRLQILGTYYRLCFGHFQNLIQHKTEYFQHILR